MSWLKLRLFTQRMQVLRWIASKIDTRILIDELAWRLGTYYTIDGEEATIENLRKRSEWYRSDSS